MLRLGDKIRLSEKDRQTLDSLSGYQETPRTVAEFNSRIEEAVKPLDAWNSAEGRLLAAIARDLKIPP
jgi:hypothetical protein